MCILLLVVVEGMCVGYVGFEGYEIWVGLVVFLFECSGVVVVIE